MTVEVGSTVPRRQLGRYLRQLRKEARITVKAVAETLEWSMPKVWRIESGATSMRAPDVAAMCAVYQASPELTEALTGLAKETKGRGWWHSYGDAIPEWFELYVGLEAATTRLRAYEPHVISGLLQTRAYATRVYEVGRPDMTRAEIERGVAVRMERQAILTRIIPRAPQVDIVLDEGTLRRSIGRGMAEQLHRINTVSEWPNVSVRVRPYSVGVDGVELVNGGFAILEFSQGGDGKGEPPIVYSEGLTGALYLEKPHEIAAYERVWGDICATCLDEAESRKLVAAIAEEAL